MLKEMKSVKRETRFDVKKKILRKNETKKTAHFNFGYDNGI